MESSWHAVDEKIEETLVVGLLQKEVFDFAKSIDAEMTHVSHCYIMRFFDYEHDLDRYICSKLRSFRYNRTPLYA